MTTGVVVVMIKHQLFDLIVPGSNLGRHLRSSLCCLVAVDLSIGNGVNAPNIPSVIILSIIYLPKETSIYLPKQNLISFM